MPFDAGFFMVQTLGNHEFDFGPSVLGTFVDQLNMPVLSSNLNVDMEPELKGKVAPYTILYVKGTAAV